MVKTAVQNFSFIHVVKEHICKY